MAELYDEVEVIDENHLFADRQGYIYQMMGLVVWVKIFGCNCRAQLDIKQVRLLGKKFNPYN